jgi:phosphatidate phosphatase PAH1
LVPPPQRSLKSTPFHVRFGKMSGLLHPKERVVRNVTLFCPILFILLRFNTDFYF